MIHSVYLFLAWHREESSGGQLWETDASNTTGQSVSLVWDAERYSVSVIAWGKMSSYRWFTDGPAAQDISEAG